MSSPALASSPRKVNFTIDINSDDFQIESLTLTFGQSDNCPRDALPKLLEWIKPNYRPVIFSDILRCCALSSNVFHACVESCPSGGFLVSLGYAMLKVAALQLGTIPRQRLCQRQSMQGQILVHTFANHQSWMLHLPSPLLIIVVRVRAPDGVQSTIRYKSIQYLQVHCRKRHLKDSESST